MGPGESPKYELLFLERFLALFRAGKAAVRKSLGGKESEEQ